MSQHPLLDECILKTIHSGEHTDLPLRAEAFLVVGPEFRKQVHVRIRDPLGREVGDLKNSFELDNGQMRARYHVVEIREGVRGHGFARSYYQMLEVSLTKYRADLITLVTWRVGGYLFAQLDFDFDVPGVTADGLQLERQRKVRELVEGAHESGRISKSEFDALEPNLFSPDELRPGALSRPAELADLPNDLGWRILADRQWDGIKWLS